MVKKIILNSAYTVGIGISLLTAYWGITHRRYEFVALGLPVAAVFIYFKIKLTKEVRRSLKQ